MSCLLGGFDDGASQLMFEKDISNLSKPEIKGRGFIGSGNEIIETQTYFTIPENDWEFDDTQKLTYNNPVYLDQCKRRGVKVDDTGWVEQHKLGDKEVEEYEEDDDEIDDDSEDDVNEEELFSRRNRPTSSNISKLSDNQPIKRNITNDDGQEVMFKFGNNDNNESSKSTISQQNEPDSNSSTINTTEEPKEISSNNTYNYGNSTEQPKIDVNNTSVRNKVEEAINKLDSSNSSQRIKLNIDRTAIESTNKTRIKININNNQ